MIKFKELFGEKEVEHFWWSVIKEFFPNCNIEAREVGHKTDGLLVDEENKIRTLIEVKEDLNLKLPSEQAKVLIQSIFYIKQYEKAGQKLPKTIFVADKNEAFIVHTNSILKYLDYDVDWKSPASQTYKKYPQMLMDIANDEKINPFVFDIKDGFNFIAIKNKLLDQNQNVTRLIKITDENLQQVFEYFLKNVLVKPVLSINETVNLFISLFVNTKDSYLHPKKRNTLYSKDYGFISVNEKNYISFFDHFDGEQYSRKEKENLTSILDRLIEDETRRKKGEFFTPTPFVNLSHKYISDTFGSDWKERFVVWDAAAGTSNLTRDYKFKELYSSTLEQSDIDTANSMGYGGNKFQFDFLNDDDSKLPEGLRNAISEGKEILFLINPPYASSANKSTKIDDDKSGVSDTKVSIKMKQEGWGKSTQNLYAQFLYKISKYQETNKNIKLGLFSPPLFLSGESFKSFREKFIIQFGFEKGFLFEASHFSEVAKGWGISFTIFNNIINDKKYILDIVDFNSDFELVSNDKKEIYHTDNVKSCSEWIREEIKGLKTFDAPQQSSPCVIKNKGVGMLVNNPLGYLLTNSNNVMLNRTGCSLFSSCYSGGHGLSIIPENLFKVTSLFTARKTITEDWITQKDEYLTPNEQHEKYEQFKNDSLIYSLFNGYNYQSSLKQIDYKGKKYDIKNEFFWLSKDELMKLSEENYYDEIYNDAKFSDERFVYNKLFKDGIYEKLSPLAKEVLDMATDLLKKSIKTRKFLSEEHPEYHLNSFDAGYAQLKLVWKEYHSEEFKSFRNKYKEFEDSMRPLVFELGFLKK